MPWLLERALVILLSAPLAALNAATFYVLASGMGYDVTWPVVLAVFWASHAAYSLDLEREVRA